MQTKQNTFTYQKKKNYIFMNPRDKLKAIPPLPIPKTPLLRIYFRQKQICLMQIQISSTMLCENINLNTFLLYYYLNVSFDIIV